MGVLHNRQLEGKMLCIGKKTFRRKDGHGNGSEVGSAGEQDHCDGRLQPATAQVSVFWHVVFVSVDSGFDHDRAGRQQHGIYGGKIVVLAMKNKEDSEANEVTPTEGAIGFESRGEE